MNLELVDKIVRAVLYEGYMLYPYTPSSVKNQQRWNFGVLYPRAYSELQTGSDAWGMQTECLVEGSVLAALEVRVEFLQMIARSVGQLETTLHELPSDQIPVFQPVEKLEINGHTFQPWQEAVEREVCLPMCSLETLCSQPLLHSFTFPAERQWDPITDANGEIPAILIRRREPLRGEISVTATTVGTELFKVCVSVRNMTTIEGSKLPSRERALLCSLVSAHTIIGVQDGKFVSAVDPPEALREAAATCTNVGTWPVLVGIEGQRDTILSSPIILYDYPQIAPESSGDLFDGTEIDEILSLRIMTLTDEEKREMRQSDERASQILERTETLPVEQLMKLHGVLRGLRPVNEEAS